MQPLRIADTREMTREEWLAARTKGIGGSDIAAICGFTPWASPMSVFLDKIGAIPPAEENEKMMWGKKLEAMIAAEFKERNAGVKVQKINAVLRHPECPIFLANIDRKITNQDGQPGVLECKNTNQFALKNWDQEREEAPEYVLAQLQWYLGVTGYSYGYAAALVGGQSYRQVYSPRDEDLIKLMQDKALSFWQLVETRTPPPIDGSDASADVLKILYPTTEKGKGIELPTEALGWIFQYEAAHSAASENEKAKKEAANNLKALMGEAEIGIVGDRKVTLKTVSKKEHMVKATSYRQLSIK